MRSLERQIAGKNKSGENFVMRGKSLLVLERAEMNCLGETFEIWGQSLKLSTAIPLAYSQLQNVESYPSLQQEEWESVGT